MKIWKYDIAYHRSFYTCEECTHMVCGCTNEDSTVLCHKKLGTLIVSRTKQGDSVHRRVPEVGLRDASTDNDDVVVYSAEKFTGDSRDS